MGLENVLDHTEGFVASFDRNRGRDPGMYYLRIFGEPGGSRPWAWRFGGHHVSLNYLIADGLLASATPCFIGADPASSPLLGKLVHRPLGRVEDLARELVSSLPAELGHYHGAVLDAVHVAWAGPLEPGQPHYYRIQGPDLLIEWDNTQRGANHAHSVWRDPSRDFGLDVLTLHHRLHH